MKSEHINGAMGYRWDGLRFDTMGTHIPTRGSLLDVGCGLGNFCRYIKARNPALDVVGIDYSKFAIKKAKTLAKNIDYMVADAFHLPFEDNTFDVISVQEIVEHVEKPKELLLEMKRVLKRKGVLLLTTPWKIGDTLMSEEHIQEWTPIEFKEISKGIFDDSKTASPIIIPYDVLNKRPLPPNWFLVRFVKT
mgnify:FL=1